MFKNILIATDGSDLAQKAIDQGLGLAKALGAKVTAVAASEPWVALAPAELGGAFPIEEYERSVAAIAKQNLAAVETAAAAAGVQCETVHVGDQYASEAILGTAASRGCDLIVMASHGRRGLSRLLLGSETNRVVIDSTIPVLVCR